jgi:LPXTG-site transpeptidase (sortase) family protein
MRDLLAVTGILFLLALACGGESNSATPEAAQATAKPSEAAGTPAPADNRISIPKLQVDAPLEVVVVGADGRMNDAQTEAVALYDWSNWPQLGGSPGAGNTTVGSFVSHPTRTNFFREIHRLVPGDEVRLAYNRQSFIYTVTGLCEVSNAGFESVISRSPSELITLIPAVGGGANRIIVRAERVPGSIGPNCPGSSRAVSDPPSPVGSPNPAQTGGVTGAPGFVLEGRYAPGTRMGNFSDFLVYRFRLSGFSGSIPDPNNALTISPQVAGRSGWGREGNSGEFVLVPFPPGVPGGRFTVSLRLSDMVTVTATFDHTP